MTKKRKSKAKAKAKPAKAKAKASPAPKRRQKSTAKPTDAQLRAREAFAEMVRERNAASKIGGRKAKTRKAKKQKPVPQADRANRVGGKPGFFFMQ